MNNSMNNDQLNMIVNNLSIAHWKFSIKLLFAYSNFYSEIKYLENRLIQFKYIPYT